jgi:hypothetical protein
MGLKEIGRGVVDCMHLAQDGDQWWAVVNTVTNLRVPSQAGNFWLAEFLLASQKGLFSMELVNETWSKR